MRAEHIIYFLIFGNVMMIINTIFFGLSFDVSTIKKKVKLLLIVITGIASFGSGLFIILTGGMMLPLGLNMVFLAVNFILEVIVFIRSMLLVPELMTQE